MIDFAAARQFMVQGQVRVNDVTEPRLTTAMLEVPRERFVPAALAELAYLDSDLQVAATGPGAPRYLLKPLVLAKLLQEAAVEPGERVLDVGCATGYGAALLAQLGGPVVALEDHPDLVREAKRNLSALGAAGVTVVQGTLAEGWPARAPYDVIVVEGRCEVMPQCLTEQLSQGGRLVCIEGRTNGAKGMAYLRTQDDVSGRPVFDAAAPLLPGFAEPQAFVF